MNPGNGIEWNWKAIERCGSIILLLNPDREDLRDGDKLKRPTPDVETGWLGTASA
jgi:hypothetical protein